MTRIHRRRAAFTLVEMMVASALIIFMMWIIATAFEKALTSFRVLKTAGDMQEKLRAATTAIRRDLTRPHFEITTGPEDLGAQRLDQPTWKPPTHGYFRIFNTNNRIVEGLDPDDPNPSVFHSVGEGDVIQFTTKLRGLRRDQVFTINANDPGSDPLSTYATLNPPWGRLHRFSFPAHNVRLAGTVPIPPAIGGGAYQEPYPEFPPQPPYLTVNPRSSPTWFTTQWAEITYFLRESPDSSPTFRRYSLYRRQNLLMNPASDPSEPADFPERVNYTAASPRPLEVPQNDSRYYEVSVWKSPFAPAPYTGTWRVNTPQMITAPCRRFGVNPTDPAGTYPGLIPTMLEQLVDSTVSNPQSGTDLLLTDVTSFEVKVLWDPTPAEGTFQQILGPQPADSIAFNPDFPFDRVPLPLQQTNSQWAGQRVFDTWSKRVPSSAVGTFDDYGTGEAWNYATAGASAKAIPLKIRVRAIQIELRIWDVKSQQSRQITIIQDV